MRAALLISEVKEQSLTSVVSARVGQAQLAAYLHRVLRPTRFILAGWVKITGVSTKEARKEPSSHRHKVRVSESVSMYERRGNRHCVKIDRNKVWEEVIEQRRARGCREIQYIKAAHSVRDKRDKEIESVSVD